MLADDIRGFVNREYVLPARRARQRYTFIRAGDVHDAMGLQGRQPAVCGALGSEKFEEQYRVRRVAVDGPINGANCFLIFEVLP